MSRFSGLPLKQVELEFLIVSDGAARAPGVDGVGDGLRRLQPHVDERDLRALPDEVVAHGLADVPTCARNDSYLVLQSHGLLLMGITGYAAAVPSVPNGTTREADTLNDSATASFSRTVSPG